MTPYRKAEEVLQDLLGMVCHNGCVGSVYLMQEYVHAVLYEFSTNELAEMLNHLDKDINHRLDTARILFKE